MFLKNYFSFNNLKLKLLFNRMTNACHKKCVPPRYNESDLTKGESICLDRCVAKYFDIHDKVGKKLASISTQQSQAQVEGQQQQ